MERGPIEAYLWLSLAGVFLLLLAVAFGYLLALRQREWLLRRFEHDYIRRLDAWLAAHLPRAWLALKARFSPKTWYGLLLTSSVVLFLALLLVFTAIATSWRTQATFYELDRSVNAALDGALSPGFVRFLGFITHFADNATALVVIALLAAFFLWRREKWHLVALVILEGIGAPLLVGLKWFFGRARPESPFIPSAGGYSFPSGHSFTAMVLYGFLIFLTWRYTEHHGVRIPVTIALVLLILMVALSRVVLSVHWVSDVVGGLTIGLAWLVASLLTTRALRDYHEPGAPI